MKKHTLKLSTNSCPFNAAQQLGLSFGADAFAKRTYQSTAVVYNKLNPDNESNHLSLRDAIALTELTNNDAIIEALCLQRGGVFVKLPENVACDEELSDQVMLLTEQLGLVMGDIRKAREDGIIDGNEFNDISANITKTIKEALALNAVVKGQVRELQPAHTHRVITKG